MYELDRKRQETMASIKRYTTNVNYNIYSMDVLYDYNLDAVMSSGFQCENQLREAIFKDALGTTKSNAELKLSTFGCTAFKIGAKGQNQIRMGRNYDFKDDTSVMLVHCPCITDGGKVRRYASVGFAALSNISLNNDVEKKEECLGAPYICLDGINENGVAIAVLTLDGTPVHETVPGRKQLSTTLAIRLVLDQAVSAPDALARLTQYNMVAFGEKDYHFYITDKNGFAYVLEYTYDDAKHCRSRAIQATDAVTNFFISYKDMALGVNPPWRYGHGQDRYVKAKRALSTWNGNDINGTAWNILKETSQLPESGTLTSNTQWSIVYNNTARTAEFAFRRNFGDVWMYNLTANSFGRKPY